MIKVNDTYSYDTIFTQEDIKYFSELTNDKTPIHVDKEAGAKSVFGGQVVPGVLVSCAYSKVYNTLWPGAQDGYFISHEQVYFKPVYVDVPYTINFECIAVDLKRHIGTLVGILVDKEGNEIVRCTAKIVSESKF